MDFACRWLPPLLLVLTVGPAGAAPEAFAAQSVREESEIVEEPPPKARQNPLLRQHFHDLYRRSLGGPYSVHEDFLERFVDRQVDLYLADVDQRLGELAAASDMVETLRIRYVAGGEGVDRREIQAALSGSLRRIADQSSRLGRQLTMVFRGIDRRKRLEIRISPESRATGFAEEIAFIGHQIDEADRLIRDYLFRSTGTVNIEDLRGEDMLVRLYWAERMARDVAGALR